MKNKRISRNYILTDAELVMAGKQKLAFMRRDAAEYAGYGITESHFEPLALQLEAFSDWETDIELINTLTQATLEKKAKARALIEALENVMVLVSLKFKKGSSRYRGFGTKSLVLQKDADLHMTAKLFVKRSIKHMAELAPCGLTMDLLNEINTLNEEYPGLLLDQQLAQANRQESNNERIALGNEIHANLMRYIAVGVAIWKAKSAARYNDYLLYDKKSGKKTA